MSGYAVMIHKNADVHHTVLLGNRCQVWNAAVILEGTQLGADCVVGNGCFIGRRCTIGEGTKVHPGAAIPDNTRIGHHVFIGAHVVLNDVALPSVEDKAQEDHRPPVIEDQVVLGSNATVLAGVVIHRGAIIGAGSVVTRDIPAGCTALGNPARITRFPAWDAPVCNEAGEVLHTVPGEEGTV